MAVFDTSGATVLTPDEMRLLVVEGSGAAIKEKLEPCGAEYSLAKLLALKRARWVYWWRTRPTYRRLVSRVWPIL